MKSLVISSNCSGGGKTTVTLGIMKALMNRGYEVQGYKVGPDYIDTAFHKHITGKPSRNLDLFLMGEEGVKASYQRGCKKTDGREKYGVVEGVMGLFDGKSITSEFSTAHHAKVLGLPVLLVITPQAQSVTLCAEINGLVDFEDVNIVGIVLNNVTEGYFRLLKAAIEKNCKIKVFGYVPKEDKLELKSRHLGLVQSSEVEDLDDKIQYCSELIEKYIDLDELLIHFNEAKYFEDKFHLDNIGLKTAVAYDEAFSFYYEENLEILKELGEVVYFSPLKDKELPKDIKFLYIGGGYPEVFIEKLSENTSMLKSIKEALENGLPCYAECGGLMYLTESIEGFSTVGFFKGSAYMTNRLQNFGYAEIEVLISGTPKFKCHEFHKSCVNSSEKTLYRVKKEGYEKDAKSWREGYIKSNTLAGYPHVHFFNFIKENYLYFLISEKKQDEIL